MKTKAKGDISWNKYTLYPELNLFLAILHQSFSDLKHPHRDREITPLDIDYAELFISQCQQIVKNKKKLMNDIFPSRGGRNRYKSSFWD